MKQYRRDAKLHMDDEEYAVWRSNRKSKTCKGGREHKFILVAPYGYTSTEQGKFLDADQIKVCYESQVGMKETMKNEEERLASLGIKTKYSNWRYSVHYRYVCEVCKKEKTTYDHA